MKIIIGCDEAALSLKSTIIGYLKEQGHEVEDCGCYDEKPVLYPEIAIKVAETVRDTEGARGILICGTGIGMAISANKVKGIRAAVCHDILSTERSILSNNVQIMCMGARIVAPQLALKFVELWMSLEFQGGNSQRKVDVIENYEQCN